MESCTRRSRGAGSSTREPHSSQLAHPEEGREFRPYLDVDDEALAELEERLEEEDGEYICSQDSESSSSGSSYSSEASSQPSEESAYRPRDKPLIQLSSGPQESNAPVILSLSAADRKRRTERAIRLTRGEVERDTVLKIAGILYSVKE